MRRRARALAATPTGAFALGLYRRFVDANAAQIAASLAFYAAFSLGPLLLLLGGWLSVVLRGRPELAEPYRDALELLVSQVLPLADDAEGLVQASVDLILGQLGEGALLRSGLSLLVLLWASTSFFTSLQYALETIFGVEKHRGYVRKRLVALLLVLAVAVFVVVEVIGVSLGNAAARGWESLQGALATYDVNLPDVRLPAALSPLRLLASALVFTLSFRLLPRHRTDWIAAAIGGVFSAVTLVVMRYLLVATFSLERFNLVYGVITGVVVLLMWLYLAMLGFLFGAVLAAEVARHRARPGRAGSHTSGTLH